MPLRPGSSPRVISQNISEFHTGKTYAHTAAKFGKQRANRQAVAVALDTARRYGKKYAEGGVAPPSLPQAEDRLGGQLRSAQERHTLDASIPISRNMDVFGRASINDMPMPAARDLKWLEPEVKAGVRFKFAEGGEVEEEPKPQPVPPTGGLDLPAPSPQDEMRSYTPTARERLTNALIGDQRPSPERRRFAEGVTNLNDFTPTGLLPFAYDVGREAAEFDPKTATPGVPSLAGAMLAPMAAGPLREMVPAAKKAGKFISDLNPEEFKTAKVVGGQMGSNPGAMYRFADGQEAYVKILPTVAHANNEKLASELYRLMEVPVPDIRLTELNGKPAIVSPLIPGSELSRVSEDFGDHTTWDNIKHLQSNFPVDAWLGNWDVIGQNFNNIITHAGQRDPYPTAYRIDMGGALNFRARGEPKVFGPQVNELQTMRDPTKNPTAAAVFGQRSAEEAKTAKKLADIPNEDIIDLVSKWGPDSFEAKNQLVQNLIQRRDAVAQYYGAVKHSDAVDVAKKSMAKSWEKIYYDQKHGWDVPELAKHVYGYAATNSPQEADKITKHLPKDVLPYLDQELNVLSDLNKYDPWKEGPIPPKQLSTKNEEEASIKKLHNEDLAKLSGEDQDYWEAIDQQLKNEHSIAAGDTYVPPSFMRRVASHLEPVDWMKYQPRETQSLKPYYFPHATPERLRELGFRPDIAIYKGGFYHNYPKEIPDPALESVRERSNFTADHPEVSRFYGVVGQPYIANPKKVFQVDWLDLTDGNVRYDPSVMNAIIEAGHKKNADAVIIHNIEDGGRPDGVPQTQYAFLKTNVLRSPRAKFDPQKLHLRQPLAGLAGGGLFGYGTLQGQEQGDGGMKRGGVPHKAGGGGMGEETWLRHQASRNLHSEGMIKSSIPGRTDKIPMSVQTGSYIIPADIPSALGQGNSVAGGAILKKMFNSGPYGLPTPKLAGRAARPPSLLRPIPYKQPKGPFPTAYAEGGDTEDAGGDHVPIVAAGGEYVIPSQVVRDLGHGSLSAGHKVLDAFVLKVRKDHISTLKKLPPPKK